MSLDDSSSCSPGEEELSKAPRTSVRVLQKQRLMTTKQQPFLSDDIEYPVSSTVLESSKKRTWEQWWSEDERSFYEALCECGKNFESMREFFVRQKVTKKTKGQIRTFYYRTWHKIARHIDFPEGLSKSTKELYGLINYGELRKRLGGKLDEKNCVKLQELVFNGSTTLRIKGKTVRLKTPMCPALKKLSSHRKISTTLLSPSSEQTDHEGGDVIRRLPRSINLSLTPLQQEDFHRVHALALQNPKLSLGTDLQRTVGSVVKYLELKWRRTNSCVSNTERLRLLPRPGTILKRPVFFPVEPLTSEDLSLGKVTQEGKEEEDPPEVPPEDPDEEKVANALWDADCTLTVGEMYLMLGPGDEQEVELNYSFQYEDEKEEDTKSFDKDERYKTLNTLIKLVQEKLKKSKAVSPVKVTIEDQEQFRRPALPTPAATAFKQQLDLLLPKYNNRKGRPMSRKNTGSRMSNGTPQRVLQPKFYMPSSKSEVKLRLLPQVTVTHPVISIQEPISLQIPSSTLQVIAAASSQEDANEGPPAVLQSPLSPTESLSSLRSTERFLDSVLDNSSLLQTPPRQRSRPPSPFSCEGNNSSMSWTFPASPFLPSEGSSFRRGSSIINEEDSSHSTNSEVDRQLLSMMTESSVDFTSKFAKLTSHITSDV